MDCASTPTPNTDSESTFTANMSSAYAPDANMDYMPTSFFGVRLVSPMTFIDPVDPTRRVPVTYTEHVQKLIVSLKAIPSIEESLGRLEDIDKWVTRAVHRAAVGLFAHSESPKGILSRRIIYALGTWTYNGLEETGAEQRHSDLIRLLGRASINDPIVRFVVSGMNARRLNKNNTPDTSVVSIFEFAAAMRATRYMLHEDDERERINADSGAAFIDIDEDLGVLVEDFNRACQRSLSLSHPDRVVHPDNSFQKRVNDCTGADAYVMDMLGYKYKVSDDAAAKLFEKFERIIAGTVTSRDFDIAMWHVSTNLLNLVRQSNPSVWPKDRMLFESVIGRGALGTFKASEYKTSLGSSAMMKLFTFGFQ